MIAESSPEFPGPWIVELADSPRHCGAKARALGELRAAGFDVPDGFVVTAAALRTPAGALAPRLAARLAESSCARWAVRSSAAREDGGELSYAGQYRTLLDVPSAGVAEAVAACARSAGEGDVRHYRADHGVGAGADDFHVLVQEMVPAEVAGVAFSVNPVTGADTEVVVESGRGLGEEVVSGRVRADRFAWDWRGGERLAPADLTAAEGRAVVELALAVQRYYGFPVDIEWAIAGGRLHLLQARPITRIQYAGIADQWTTANFRDGGVSSTVCTPYMWSLYAYIWDRWMPRYLIESKLARPDQLGEVGRMFFGRPYWNLSAVKTALAIAPGFRERQFDAELGVRIDYAGDGRTTPITPVSVARIARVALTQRRIVAAHRETVQATHDRLLATAAAHRDWLAAPAGENEVEQTWRRLVFDDHDLATGTYFWQIFINHVHQALLKAALEKLVGEDGYFRLISGLDGVSHLRPFAAAWDLSRAIRTDPLDRAYWTERSVARITADVDDGATAHRLEEVRRLIARFGHHSTRELDVSHPDFDTDHAAVVTMVRDAVGLGDEHGPAVRLARLHDEYAAELARAERRAGPLRARRLRRRIEENRRMLWWREELKDVSTLFFHLIRRTTLRLAGVLVARGVLERLDDVWFCGLADLAGHLDGRVTPEELRALVARNRAYHESFRNFEPPHEIGGRHTGAVAEPIERPAAAGALQGVGASAGTVEGTARVVAGLDELDRVRPGDILVTRFTDTGWTGKFALLGGLVLEHGGVLAHAAVVAREYGIPCVVACPDALARIPDGARVRIDGVSGAVVVR